MTVDESPPNAKVVKTQLRITHSQLHSFIAAQILLLNSWWAYHGTTQMQLVLQCRCTTQKIKFSVKGSFSNCTADLVTFSEKILIGKLHLLCSIIFGLCSCHKHNKYHCHIYLFSILICTPNA